jgi:hypothetical protein
MAFSVSPVRQVATASMNVVMPNVAWIGTNEARKAAVAPSQHSKIRKLKKPTINCQQIRKVYFIINEHIQIYTF